MKRLLSTIVLGILWGSQIAMAADFQVLPVIGFPIGPDARIFTLGVGGDASLKFPLPFVPSLSLGPSLGYYYLSVQDDFSTVSLLNGGVGGAFTWTIAPWLNVNFNAGGGYYRAMMSDPDTSDGSGWFYSGAGMGFRIFDGLNLGLSAGYRSFLGMYQDVYASVNINVLFKEKPKAVMIASPPEPAPVPKGRIEIVETKLATVFPVFYTWYDNNPIGSVVVENTGPEAIDNVQVSFFVESFMDNPKISQSIERLMPGERVEVPVFALFNNKMMDVSEGTKASYKISIDYSAGDQKQNLNQAEALSMYDRNSLSWDDDRKAATFVTAKDQSVLSFAKNVAALAPANTAIDENLRIAMVIHEALRIYGMHYIVDPASAYTDLSKNESSVDYLQFPRQTLEYKSGDCDDLSILYCALLESVNVETAFITVPGHIYAAFALQSSPDETRKKYLKADDFILTDNKAWVPVEVTMTKDSFLHAWQKGAEEWIESSARQQAALFPIREAWLEYKPVGFPGTFALAIPSNDTVTKTSASEMEKFINKEIAPRVALCKADIVASGESPKSINKMGVLYAKYGLYEQAKTEFERAVKNQDYLQSFMNLGNLAFQQNDMQTASTWYNKALGMESANQKAILAMARVAHELENYGETKKYYATLMQLNPDLASQFAYLDLKGSESNRAADVSKAKSKVLWED